jgi:NitT/TauT family transport system substrate-binding protein
VLDLQVRINMLNRRRALQGGLATAVSVTVAVPHGSGAQPKPASLRYNEVVRAVLYVPAYVAVTRGFFQEQGIEPSIATAQGGDKCMAALLSDAADIALIGPETAIYVLNSDSPTKVRIFCALTSTDGFMLMGRQKVDKFEWSMLKGKEILGFRPGSTPLLFLEAALRKNGIDPQKDVKLVNNVAIPARVGSWLAGQNQYGIFIEPDASQLELDGKGYFLASTVGPADYTAFMATDKYIHDNPKILQAWTDAIYKAQQWTRNASTADIVEAIREFFPGVNPRALAAATDRYRRLKIWKDTPVIAPSAIERFQDILVEGDVLTNAKRVRFADLVLTEFASKAK